MDLMAFDLIEPPLLPFIAPWYMVYIRRSRNPTPHFNQRRDRSYVFRAGGRQTLSSGRIVSYHSLWGAPRACLGDSDWVLDSHWNRMCDKCAMLVTPIKNLGCNLMGYGIIINYVDL